MKKNIKKRIAIVLPDFAVIGAQRVALDYGLHFMKSGFDVVWISGDSGRSGNYDIEESNVHSFAPKLFSKVRGLRIFERAIRLANHFRNNKYDYVFSVTPLINRFLCLYKALKIIDANLVIEDHGYPPRSYIDEFPKLLIQLLYRHTEWLYGHANIMRTLTDDCRRYYIGRNKKINAVAFPNLMNFDRLEKFATKAIQPSKMADIVYIGRFETQKNISFLLECFAVLIKIPANESLKLFLIGYGSQESLLRKKIDFLGINDNVKLLSNSPENFAYLSYAKVFPLTSIWEGFPLVLIEAMYLGVAVVSVDCQTGPKEIIGTDSSRGWLVNENDRESFVKNLDIAINNNEERKARTRIAKSYVEQHLNIDLRFAEYLNIFFNKF